MVGLASPKTVGLRPVTRRRGVCLTSATGAATRSPPALRWIPHPRRPRSSRTSSARLTAEAPSIPPGPSVATDWTPVRTITGGLSFGGLPRELWPDAERATGGENPRWSAALCCALYWADGRRRVAEIQALTQHEFATLNVDLAEYFAFLAQHGYVGRGDSRTEEHQEDLRPS